MSSLLAVGLVKTLNQNKKINIEELEISIVSIVCLQTNK